MIHRSFAWDDPAPSACKYFCPNELREGGFQKPALPNGSISVGNAWNQTGTSVRSNFLEACRRILRITFLSAVVVAGPLDRGPASVLHAGRPLRELVARSLAALRVSDPVGDLPGEASSRMEIEPARAEQFEAHLPGRPVQQDWPAERLEPVQRVQQPGG